MARCDTSAIGRRRPFWATQPNACGTETTRCGYRCGTPGLAFKDTWEGDNTATPVRPDCDPTQNPGCEDQVGPGLREIATSDWVQGLVINMLMTDGKAPDRDCGYRPGSQGGHWSESYITGNGQVGTLMRSVGATGTTQELVSLVTAYASATLTRMVDYGIAVDVEVEGSYVGQGVVQLDITIFGRNQDITKVGLSGTRLENSWLWE